MNAHIGPFCEIRPRPHGVSSFPIEGRGVVAFDPRIISSHYELYMSLWRESYDANRAACLERMRTRKAG